jgi:4a-hydroxytetrahydrobiopterin dehydratase
MDRLENDVIETAIAQGEWRNEDGGIVRDYSLPNFESAIQFVHSVAGVAEVANHHPDILIHDWNQVRITCTTHSAGGVTDADLALAKEIDELA